MAFVPVSGILAEVKVGSTLYAFDKWELDASSTTPDVSNFLGVGYVQRTEGLIDGSITLSGPYNLNNSPFTVNDTYDLILGWNDTIQLTGSAILQSIKSSQDVKDAGRISLKFVTNGPFDSEIV